jgi:tetratricopeptide (TPR) repeat protein
MKRPVWLSLLLFLASITGHANQASEQLCEQANAKAHQGDIDGALADFTSAIQADPKDVHAYCGRGGARQQKGQLDEALADYSQAIAIDPSYAWAYKDRAEVEGKKGNLNDAIVDYSRAIELDPKMQDAYSGRENVERVKGDFRGATSDLAQLADLRAESQRNFDNNLPQMKITNGIGLMIEPSEPQVGREMTLDIKLYDVGEGETRLPRVDGLQLDGRSVQNNITLQNGVMSSWLGLSYTLCPTRTGDFTIPPWDVQNQKGQILHIPALSFHVKDRTAQADSMPDTSTAEKTAVPVPTKAQPPAPSDHD